MSTIDGCITCSAAMIKATMPNTERLNKVVASARDHGFSLVRRPPSQASAIGRDSIGEDSADKAHSRR